MGTEIERKWVLSAIPRLPGETAAIPIRQGYLAADDNSEVRLREIGGRPKLTVKTGSGLRRGETEIELEADQFDALWPLTEGARVEKVRHRYDHGTATIEIDVYGGRHEGLIVAEIEFESVAASEAFDAPEWLGIEVTGDERWANRSLALAVGPPADPGQ